MKKYLILLLLFINFSFTAFAKPHFKLGMALEPPHLDPSAGAAGAIDEIVYNNLFEGLVTLDQAGKVQPLLAKKWKISKDKKTYIFELQKNVFFHDGKKLTADDVVFSLNRIIAKKSVNAQKALYQPIEKIEKLAENRLQVNLKFPYRNFLYYLAWGDAVIVNSKNYKKNKTHPIGTGPFQFEKWVRGNRVELKKNTKYWAKKPALEKVSFFFIADPANSFFALLSGDIDAYANFPSPENISLLQKEKRFKIVIGNTEGETLLAMNNKKSPLNNIKVRHAIQYAVNRTEIIQGAMFGYATPIGSHFSPNHKDYLDLSNHYPLDLEKARSLLKQAGYPNGFKATLKLPPPSYARRSGEILQQQLAKIGIRLKIVPVEWAQWLQDVFKNKEYDFTIIAHTEPYDFNIYAREKYYFNYQNEHFNALIEELKQTFSTKKRKILHHLIMRRLTDDAVNVFLFQRPKLGVWKKNVTGMWENSPIQANVLRDVVIK